MMTTGRVAKTLAVLAPVTAILGIGLPIYFGAYEFAILGLYATVPLLTAPYLYRLSLREKRDAHTCNTVLATKKSLAVAYLLSLSVALGFASTIPRPRVFFVALSVCNTVALVYCLVHKRQFVPLLFVSVSTLVFHLSTTVTKSLYIGSGDTSVVWLGVQNSIEQARLAPHAGYDLFPAFYSFMIIGDGLLGFNSPVSMFLLGAGMMVGALWFVFLLSHWLSIFPADYAALPAVLLTFMYYFNYMGLYTIPQMTFAFLALVPLGIIVGSLYGSIDISRRYVIVVLIMFASLTWHHKTAHIWFLAVLFLFIGTAIVTDVACGDGRALGTLRGLVDHMATRIPAIGLLSAFVIAFSYTFLYSNFPEIVLGYLLAFLQPSAITGSGNSGGYLVRNPVGMLFTFTGSSIVLLLFLTGFFTAMASNSRRLKGFTFATLVLSVTYFPGPVHVSEALSQLHIHRMTKLVFAFVAIVAAIGIVRTWNTSGKTVRVLLIVLVLTGGVFTLSNDMYTRDNPISETGTFTNYLTEHETASMEFSTTYTDEIVVDVRSADYMEMNHHLDTYEGDGTAANPLSIESTDGLCEHPVLLHESELDRRHALLFYHDIEIERSDAIPQKESRSQIYSNGADRIVGAGGDQCA